MNAFETLHRQIDAMAQGFVAQVPTLAIAVAIILITWLVARSAVRIADRLTSKAPMRDNLKQLSETLVRLAIWLIGLMIAATVAMPGLTPASLFAGLGIGAVAIGFAFQDIFQNFLAGVLIMLRDKMRIGDLIVCQGINGRVERITLRETHVRAPSNELTIVPNAILFKNPVEVLTDSPLRRFELVVNLPDDADLDAATQAIHTAVREIDTVASERGVDVYAQDMKGKSVEVLVRWWAGSRPHDMRATRDAIIRKVRAAIAALPDRLGETA
ncbi:MAG: mechanosensitive ion channel family protein [Novosphingobium sp.]|nr:mechanosensitive ion channel family protein [Novosphingobium sp.]